MKKQGLFISGTDTGIGKTIVSTLLVSAFNQYGIRCGYFKPIQTGTDLDTDTVANLSGKNIQEWPAPTYYFSQPAAPSIAAHAEGKSIDLNRVIENWNSLDSKVWVLEGAGGLLVPLNSEETIRELIVRMGLRLLLVSSTRLGTINHTLLSVEAAKHAGIEMVGIVLVGEEEPQSRAVIERMSGVPVLARVPNFREISQSVIQENAQEIFSKACIRKMYDPFID